MAGSVVFSYVLSSDGRVVKLIYQCTSDASGNISAPTITQSGDTSIFQPNSLLTGVIGQIRINPGAGSVQPSASFAVQMNKADDATLDFLGGLGASCSNTNTLMDVPSSPVNGAGISLFHDILVPYASGVGASKQFTVKVYLWLKGK
ncbi:MAG: hypothetical protein ACYDHZ_00465 [Dehalococcoidia bacterium]